MTLGADPGPALDPALFARLRGMLGELGPGLFEEVLELYLEDAPPRAAALRALDDAGRRRAAHALRGSASSIGAARLSEICAAIEDAPPGADLGERVTALEREMARVVQAVRAALVLAEG